MIGKARERWEYVYGQSPSSQGRPSLKANQRGAYGFGKGGQPQTRTHVSGGFWFSHQLELPFPLAAASDNFVTEEMGQSRAQSGLLNILRLKPYDAERSFSDGLGRVASTMKEGRSMRGGRRTLNGRSRAGASRSITHR